MDDQHIVDPFADASIDDQHGPVEPHHSTASNEHRTWKIIYGGLERRAGRSHGY